MMMMIIPNSRARNGGKESGEVKREYGRIRGEEEGNAEWGGDGATQSAPCVKGVSGDWAR